MPECATRGIELLHYKPEIGFELDELYVNAGVLVLNLAEMRREGLFRKLCAATQELEGRIRFQDQDIINIVCRGRILELPDRFNFTSEYVRDYPTGVPGLLSSTTPAPGNPGRLRSAPMP